MVTRALAGVTVVDFTRFVSGSYATMVLAALGADVVKLERLPDGDPYRVTGAGSDGGSPLFDALNSGKRSITVDFDVDADRRLVDALIERADVFVENARPGSLVRLGLDAERLVARNPRLVYASVTAFGPVGPDHARGGFDLILQAETGLMSVTGDEQTGPSKVGLPLLDVGAGLSCVVGILAALAQRATTQRGTVVSASLFEFGLSGFITQVDAIMRDGMVPGLLGSHSPTFAPYGSFQCADRSIVLAGAGSEDLWIRLCDVLGARDMAEDPRFGTNSLRLRHRQELTELLESKLTTAPADHWLARLEAAGVPAGEVRNAADSLKSPQAAALGSVYEEVSTSSPYWTIAPPVRMEGVAVRPSRAAPHLGEHTAEVRAWLGESP